MHGVQVACGQACFPDSINSTPRAGGSREPGFHESQRETQSSASTQIPLVFVALRHARCIFLLKMTWNLYYEGTSALLILLCIVLRAEHLSKLRYSLDPLLNYAKSSGY